MKIWTKQKTSDWLAKQYDNLLNLLSEFEKPVEQSIHFGLLFPYIVHAGRYGKNIDFKKSVGFKRQPYEIAMIGDDYNRILILNDVSDEKEIFSVCYNLSPNSIAVWDLKKMNGYFVPDFYFKKKIMKKVNKKYEGSAKRKIINLIQILTNEQEIT